MHEDGDILVVDKPPGLLTANVPGEQREALFELVKEHVRGASGRPRRVWIVHRLDKEASGLLVFAKNERAYFRLKDDLRMRRMHRLYTAVVEGTMGQAAVAGKPGSLPGGTIQSYIRDEPMGIPRSVAIGDVARTGGRRAAPNSRPGPAREGQDLDADDGPLEPDAPRLAVTHWQARAFGHGRTLVQCRLETGRKNQIRVHLSEAGHPIVGDLRFGASADPIGRVALHATELGFVHPGTGISVRYRSAPPPTFAMLVGQKAGQADVPVADAPSTDAPTTGAPDLSTQPTQADAAPTAAHVFSTAAARGEGDTSWDAVADWYDELIEEDRSDYFRDVIVPGTLALLTPAPGSRVLDVACGQGALCRALATMGVLASGVDAAPRLVEAARARAAVLGDSAPRFVVGDARDLTAALTSLDARPGSFDAITCIMALMNIDAIEPVARGVHDALKPGGRFVAVVLHPAFRAPGRTSWGWDDPRPPRDDRALRRDAQAPKPRQYRRVDAYLTPAQVPITMNPGGAAHGAEAIVTWTFHRPIQAYVRALAEAGLIIDAIEEWPSLRRSKAGPTPRGKARAAEENRARREIPMFLAIRAARPHGT